MQEWGEENDVHLWKVFCECSKPNWL